MSVPDLNPLAMLELSVEETGDEIESDSDVEFIDEVPSEKELGLWVETQEAVATIVNADTNNGQVAKAPSAPTNSTNLQPEVQEVFGYPRVPLFDLTEEPPLHVHVGEKEPEQSDPLSKKKRIITTNFERNFRRHFFKENPHVGKFRLHCTICDVHLGTAGVHSGRVKLHFCLRVLVCSKCYKARIVDNTKDTTCNWCYTTLDRSSDKYIRCSKCPAVFCQICVERNLGLDVCKELDSSPMWKCFICDSRQIWPHRVIACGLLKHLQKSKINQLSSPEEYVMDLTDCCKNKLPSTNVTSGPSTSSIAPATTSQIGIAMPRYKSPPPLLPMPRIPDTLRDSNNIPNYTFINENNEQIHTIIDQNNEGRQIFVQGINNIGHISSQHQKSITQQPNNRTYIYPSSMKQMFPSLTLNSGPQVIQNVFNNRRVVLVTPNQDPKGQPVSLIRSSSQHYMIPDDQMPLSETENIANNNDINRIQILNPETTPSVMLQAPNKPKRIKIIHSGTLNDGNKFAFAYDKTGKLIDTSNGYEIGNPVGIYNASKINNAQEIVSNGYSENAGNVGLLSLMKTKQPEMVNNTSENINLSSILHRKPSDNTIGNIHVASSILRDLSYKANNTENINLTTLLRNQLVGEPQNTSGFINLVSLLNHNPSEKVCNTTSSNVSPILCYNLSDSTNNTIANVNTPSVVCSKNTGRRTSSILEAVLSEGKETDPLAISETTVDEDDVIFIENDPDCELSDPVVNFVDVQSDDVVKEVNITNIMETTDIHEVITLDKPEEQDIVTEPPRPKIKIKAIEELVNVNENKINGDQRTKETVKTNCVIDLQKPLETTEEPLIDMKSLKQAIDSVQRVLISVIKSIRVNRLAVKSYNEMKCEASMASKYVTSVQDDLQMCTRQINVIQSNIYEYYKDVPGVLEPSSVIGNVSHTKMKKGKTYLSEPSKSVAVEDNGRHDTDLPNDNISNTNVNIQSTNYLDNFTKFLSSYESNPRFQSVTYKSPESKYSLSRKHKPNQQNDIDNLNFVINGSSKSKRPKLDFDLRNKRNISGSPIVTEDDLRNQNQKHSSYSCKSDKGLVKKSHSKYSYLLKKYEIKRCSVLLHRLDPQLIRLHERN